MRGVAAIVTIGQKTETVTFAELADYLTRRRVEPESSTELPDFIPPFLSVSDTAAEKLFASSGVTLAEALAKAKRDDFTPMDLNQSATITVKLKKAIGVSNNVVGLLEGSDPKLKSQALVYSAHYDAYGISADNRIYHGAADNALGVAEMLARGNQAASFDNFSCRHGGRVRWVRFGLLGEESNLEDSTSRCGSQSRRDGH
jgi:hypothetical protein